VDVLASALAGIRHLAARGVPVISFCVPIFIGGVAAPVLAAGSRFHFPLPFDPDRFQDAVRQCLPSLFEAPASAR
jgi:hypothetical protein